MKSSIRDLAFAISATLGAVSATDVRAESGELACAGLAVRVVDDAGEPVASAAVALASGARLESDVGGQLCLDPPPAPGDTLVVTAEGHAVAARRIPDLRDRRPALRIELQPAFGEEIVVSATRTARRLLDLPIHVQPIDRGTLEASAARNLAEAVEYTSGIRIENNCQNCNTAAVRMLGLEGPYTQLLVDGQPTVSSLAMVYGLEQIPARLLDGIEIVKGGGGAMYGASAVGGTINLIPHQPDHGHVDVDVSWGATAGEPAGTLQGLWDTGSADGRRAFSLYGQLDRLEPVDVDGDGFSEVAHRELAAGGVRGDLYLFGNRARLSGDLNLTAAERRGGDLLRFHLPPHETALTEAIDTDRRAGSLRLLHTPGSRFDYRVALSWAETERQSYYGAGFDPTAYGETTNPIAVGDLQSNHHLTASTVTWGVQWTSDRIDDRQPGFGRRIEESHRDLGLFAQDDRALGGKVGVLWGLRVDDHSALDDPVVSPRLALLWSPLPELTVRGSVAGGFRPPATFDEDLHIELVGGGRARVVSLDPELTEERSLATLLGAEWRPVFARRGSAALELNLFRTRLDDLFFDREVDDPSTPALELLKVNLGGATVEGVELAGAVRWGSRLQADFGFVRQSARRDEAEPDFGARDFYRTPERYGSLGLQWSLPWELDLFGGVLYTGPMLVPHYAGFVADDRLERSPASLTFDLNLTRTVPLGGERELRLTVGGRNLTDEYQRDLDRGPERDASYVYGPRFPRSWFFTLGLRL